MPEALRADAARDRCELLALRFLLFKIGVGILSISLLSFIFLMCTFILIISDSTPVAFKL